ncbi:MAG: phosphoribosylamine--glycine ligase [Rhodobiaceae bacterium]|nr:phosphoribosylamine--glycine ligase [Rhodobiaceae bacterium]RPF97231.1 MAG: phosphoribosylamine--glycine ligase [Rhizobiales bacterium TMED227]
MKILIIGSGGREHAISMALSKNSNNNKIYAIPGNPGMLEYCECININQLQFNEIISFIKKNSIDLVIIGPEVPICEGLTDIIEDIGVKVFAPNMLASKLESSKRFTKELSLDNNIPTSDAKWFIDFFSAERYLKSLKPPYVIKADGLAAGKGVSISENYDDAIIALEDIFNGRFGENQSVLIEEFLVGEEISYFAVTDGVNICPLIGAQDHKRLLDGDLGPNTGGMGAYCPPPLLSKNLENKIISHILEPTLYGLKNRGINYKGVLFAGLMVKDNEPKLIEYNIRFGDPETQALLMLLKSDFTELVMSVVNEDLKSYKLEWYDQKALTVVLANDGYPNQYNQNEEITGIDEAEMNPKIKVFHAGTKIRDEKLIASGGRVLNVTSIDESIENARENAYQAIKKINYRGKIYREDIAWRALV